MRSFFFISLMNSAAWGGSEELWFRSAIHLAKKGCKVAACCFNWPGKEKKIQELAEAGCELYLLPGRNETRSVFKKIKLRSLISTLPIENYDEVIINQGGWKDIVHGPFKNIYKRCKSFSVVYHNYDKEKLQADKLKLFSKWINHAKKNFGDAEKIFLTIGEVNTIKIPNQQIVFNPITFVAPGEYTSFISDPTDKLNLIVLAQLDIKRKAQDILIAALSSEKWKTRNWELHLYGNGDDMQLLSKMINDHGLQNKIFLKGYSRDIPEIISWSHILLQLTHLDAMPISVTEAMAMSRPVIASNVGDMPLWIQDDINGWIANAVTIEAIDEVLEKAWQQRNRLDAMGKESFNIFTNKYPADPISHFLDSTGISVMEK